MISYELLQWIVFLCIAIVFLLVFASFYLLLQSLSMRPAGRTIYRMLKRREPAIYSGMLHWMLGLPLPPQKAERKSRLLMLSGIRMQLNTYEILRRSILFFSALTALLCMLLWRNTGGQVKLYCFWIAAAAFLLLFALLMDKTLLQMLQSRRKWLVTHELHRISRQLLYFKGTVTNLHFQLLQCIPLTHALRDDLYLLTSEWYHDADKAIQRFKSRVATEEGYSFAETLQAMRSHSHGNYYELLRQRLSDYKERLEMMRESRKEVTSYLLFVLAGIPILNTFHIFIYPWVVEGRKLFDSIGS